jgi:hypothetical protein
MVHSSRGFSPSQRGGCNKAEHSHDCGQEAGRMSELSDSLIFTLLFHLGPQPVGMVSPTFRMGLPPLVNPLWKHTHRHTSGCALLISNVFLNPIKLTIKINHHTFLIGLNSKHSPQFLAIYIFSLSLPSSPHHLYICISLSLSLGVCVCCI